MTRRRVKQIGKVFTLLCTIVIVMLSLAVTVLAYEYGEAPQLRQLVEQGKLEPVHERLPEEPLVIKPVEEIGQYGGTARVVTLRPQIMEDGGLLNNQEPILILGTDSSTIEPNLAVDWEWNEDATSLTLHLRRGVRWSDGHPFTAEDIAFWFEDVILHDELTPVKPAHWSPGGQLMRVHKIDDYTVTLEFAVPYPLAELLLAHMPGTEGNFFYPKHYLKQFHPRYTPKDRLEEMAREQGYESWVQMFLAKAEINSGSGRAVPPGTPTLKAYRSAAVYPDRVIFERNPYYWKVDTAGNQLPYIDQIIVEILQDRELVNLKITGGEVDFAAFNTALETTRFTERPLRTRV